MRCGRTFRLARTHPAHARSSGSETLSRSRSLVGYTIDTRESEFSEATPFLARRLCPHSVHSTRSTKFKLMHYLNARVLACFRGQWPDLKIAVAGFELGLVSA